MATPRVTVVVPLYNKGGLVDRAISSLKLQTWEDFEAIVVDDGSTDEGPGQVEAAADPRIRLVRQGNAGPGAARNTGLGLARGEWVAFLDADDAWMPEYLERSLSAVETGSGVSVSSSYIEMPSGEDLSRYWVQRGVTSESFRLEGATGLDRMIAMVSFMSPCTTVTRTEVLRRLGGFYDRNRCRYGEDADLYLRLLLTEPVTFVVEAWTKVYRDASALSGNYAGARPVEPFLEDPDRIRRICPAELSELLEEFLAARAYKTATVLGYWGKSAESAALRRKFTHPQGWKLPFYVPSLVAGWRVAGWLGRLHRQWR